MPRPTKKTTSSTYTRQSKYRVAGKRTYRRKRYPKSKKNAFNNTQTMNIPKKKLFKFVKHFAPGASESATTQQSCFFALNENNILNQTDTIDQYGTTSIAITNWNWKNPSTSYLNSWDRLTAFYEKACLVGTKLTISFTNTDTVPIKVIAGVCDWNTVKTITTPSYAEFQQINNHRVLMLNAAGQSGSTKTLTFKVNPNKLVGHFKPLSDTDLANPRTLLNPLLKPYYNVDASQEGDNHIAQDYLAFFYSQAVKLSDGTVALPRNDKVIENSYVFTDPRMDGINAN